MTGTRPRHVLAEHARLAGLGRIARVHRQRREVSVAPALLAVAAVPAVIAVFALVLSDSPHWRLPVLGYAALLWLNAAWLRWGPIKGPDGRRWFAVAEGGVLVWSPASAAAPSAIPWDEVRVRRRPAPPTTHQLVWQEDDREHVVDVPMASAVSRRTDLLSALRRRGPVPPWTLARLAGTAVIGVATVLVGWFAAVPVALDVVLGERPDHITDFSRMCEGGGAFGRAAPYHGAGPHPVAVYNEYGGYPDYHDSPVEDAMGWPPAGSVQLVGCSRLVGRAAETGIATCPYEGGYTVTDYQGRYQVDVYEARTGRAVESFTVDGRVGGDCLEHIYVRPGSPRDRSYETVPSDASYAAALAPLVNGEAR